jgi:hypothetical protein
LTRDEFDRKTQSGELKFEHKQATEETVNPDDIIIDREWKSDPHFWNHHGRSKNEYLEYVSSGQAAGQEPPKVYKCGDKYILVDDGNHRVAASQELNRPIKVSVTGEYIEKSKVQEMNEDYEDEMSM